MDKQQTMNNHLNLPYVTENLPGVGGLLRRNIDHFLVEEIPLYEPEGQGQHLYVNLTKKAMTTREIQSKLATLFDIHINDVGFAGLKDKYACATQTFSLLVGEVDHNFVNASMKKISDSLPVTVHWAKLHRNKLKPGHLLGNRFTILVSDIDLSKDEELNRAVTIIDQLRKRGVPNFFGPQRFGFDGDNIRRGFEIIQGRENNVDRWLRRLLISSYQSYLCNLYLYRRLKINAFDHILPGDIAKKYSTGGLFQVDDAEKEQSRYENHEISFTAPIYGSKMWSASSQAGELENEILDEAGITLENFNSAGIKGTRRLGRLLIPDLIVKLVSQGLLVKFSLPKGAFATTVMREIMKVDLTKSVLL